MAESKQAGFADFVSKIVKDPKAPPETTLVVGFLGRSSEEGHTRLYLNAELTDYVEVPNDAILHAEEASGEGPSLGAKYVWIARDAAVLHGRAGPDRYKASFLEGRITQAYMGSAQAAQVPDLGGGWPWPVPTIGFCPTLGCPPPTLACPTRFGCPTHFGCPPPTLVCPTHFLCPTIVCPTHLGCPTIVCPTRQPYCVPTLVGCPSHVICPTLACPSHPICPTAVCPSGIACGGTPGGGLGPVI